MPLLRAASLFLTTLGLSATAQAGVTQTFAPDNDLWMEDNLAFTQTMTEADFNTIIDKADSYYQPIAKRNRERLVINRRWTDSTVNANCGRMWGKVTINMFGGLARRPEITQDGFALVLCHELGHAYGGTPYISASRKMSAEGQADFYGAGECLKFVLPLLPAKTEEIQNTPYETAKCAALYPNDDTANQLCLRQFAAGQSTANLLAVLMKEDLPNYETPDPTVVPQTLTSYPATVQCRLDTYNNGILGMVRPACWFKK